MHASGSELINSFRVLQRVGLAPGWRVADLGCGALGHFVFPAAQLVGSEGMVYAVDIQKTALRSIERTARAEHYWNVQPVWSDIEVVNAAHIPNGSLDLAIVANNVFLCHNRAGLAQEALRLVKPGGRILVIEWKKAPSALGPALDHRLSEEETKSYFASPDLKLTDEFPAGPEHYALVFERLSHDPVTEIMAVSDPLTRAA